MTLTAFIIALLALDQSALSRADPVKLAARHGLPVETCVGLFAMRRGW